MPEPQIIIGHGGGFHNEGNSVTRVEGGKGYKDLSTVCLVPTRGWIQSRVVDSWMSLAPPMNQKFTRITIQGMEVAEAYNHGIQTVLDHPELSKWRYILTLEEDNLPPPDGLLKLYESIDDYAAVGGLYWTKGEAGQPMIYGNPKDVLNFRPQIPEPDTVQECCGLGMGFTLFRLDLFRDEELPKPWFKTVQEWNPNKKGGSAFTQDLYFFQNLRRSGYKVACDTRVKVGHIDEEGFIW